MAIIQPFLFRFRTVLSGQVIPVKHRVPSLVEKGVAYYDDVDVRLFVEWHEGEAVTKL